ncbi:hypothetical protein L1N85_25770 [Paenibacillus alkaliterrae]|uniref:DUF6805 domain-containing protein n=1 Tax=Paenibacillus alkaliterrae TaxID=320909 RepID=UPI001F27089F|nr:DUF6805 domain-containing protein [Paenibacillus alkaliterrae]MCF2941741.1 hypothetical protein [Paenibacillus alkaliterrae]
MHNKLYSVYWDLFTEECWEKAEKEYVITRENMRILEQNTIDFVQPGEMQPERDHNFQGGNTGAGTILNRAYRYTSIDGWFEFDILVNDVPVTDAVDGVKEMNKFYNVNYKIPEASIDGKNVANVTFRAHAGRRIREVFGLRIVRE